MINGARELYRTLAFDASMRKRLRDISALYIYGSTESVYRWMDRNFCARFYFYLSFLFLNNLLVCKKIVKQVRVYQVQTGASKNIMRMREREREGGGRGFDYSYENLCRCYA